MRAATCVIGFGAGVLVGLRWFYLDTAAMSGTGVWMLRGLRFLFMLFGGLMIALPLALPGISRDQWQRHRRWFKP